MTSVPFRGGAIDLSALKPAPPAPTGAVWWVEADERSFESYLGLSMQHPLVVEFWSPRAPNAAQMSADLKEIANQAAGSFLLVRVNVDEAPGLAQALQVTAVPMVVGVIGGQLAPMFQGTTSKEEAKAVIDQLVSLAAQNGLSGRAQPVLPEGEQADAAGPDPRFAAADAALERGDFAAAVEEFDKLLAANPADAEASAGKAQASLMVRLGGANAADIQAKADADPADVDAQMAMADLEVASGHLEPAFARLVNAVRLTSGAERESARSRLLELFETVGATDPAVLQARRDLMSALF
ncbi:MAG: tetratricopeptide repeat protein [Propionibacteriaceae bacterium]|nr:tetratricopeptide repeat protein [Propionibacteriaceae bacterium]